MRRPVLVMIPVAVGVLLVTLAVIGVTTAYNHAKDARDLAELTAPSPWPRDELLVPDGPADSHRFGWLDGTGLGVSFQLTLADGRSVPVVWQQHERFPDGGLVEGTECASVAVVICTDLGDGVTLVTGRNPENADNSPDGVALYRYGQDRPVSVTVPVPDPVDPDVLRPLLDRTHRPDDAELLELLRPDGYQTDWS